MNEDWKLFFKEQEQNNNVFFTASIQKNIVTLIRISIKEEIKKASKNRRKTAKLFHSDDIMSYVENATYRKKPATTKKWIVQRTIIQNQRATTGCTSLH